VNKPQANRFKQQSLDDLRQMYVAGTAGPSDATNAFPGACYLCMRHFAGGEGRIWKLLGSVPGTRILCQSCDTQARTPVAEGDRK
jgi:hypothetical protein